MAAGGRSPRLLAAALALVLVAGLLVVGVLVWKRLTRPELEQALRAVPASSLRIGFTDWARVRDELGADLGGKPKPDAVESFVAKAYDADFTAASSIDASGAALQKYYGFSPGTAQWEAYAQGKQGAVMVLRLPDADFDDLAGNLRSIGYRRPAEDDGVWSGGVDLVANLDPTLTPELQYVALLDGQDLVVTSDNRQFAAKAAKVAAGDGASAASQDSNGDLAGALKHPANAMIWTGDFACEDLAMSRADDDAQAQAEDLVSRAGGVDPLTGLAMAMDADRTLQVVESFEDADRARRNLRPRAKLAVGEAVGRGGSFADSFELTRSRAVGSTVRLTLRPRQRTGYVLSALYDGPLVFATC
jgi:hypothetical protein